MKKLLTSIILLLLACTLLWGCSNDDTSTTTATLYYNLDTGAALEPDANGVYTVNFVTGIEKKTFKVTDKTMFEELQLLDFVGLTLDGDTITGFTRMTDMPYSRVARNYYVQSMGGNTIKMNTLSSYNGRDVLLELPEGLPFYDITPYATTFGEITTLQKNDCISIIADETGTPAFGYLISRPSKPHEGKLYCQHCEKEVEWLDWISSDTMPGNTGHYLLSSDVVMSTTSTMGAGQVCLDLNGKTVTMTTFGTRIYSHQSGGTLSIMDSVGGGTFYPASAEASSPAKWGMVVFVNNYDSVLNLYSGTLDASDCTARYGCAVSQKEGTFNMYGGTIIGGSTFGQGSSAVSANGFFNMYGGKIIGGTNIKTDFIPEAPAGGGAIRVLGYTTIYGGTIEGGESYGGGGVIRVCAGSNGFPGVLTLKGGTITGGKAPQGGGIYVAGLSTLKISGNPVVSGAEGGNLYLEDGSIFTVGDEGIADGVQIGIDADNSNFATEIPDDVDLSKYFFCDDASKKLSKQSDGTWLLK